MAGCWCAIVLRSYRMLEYEHDGARFGYAYSVDGQPASTTIFLDVSLGPTEDMQYSVFSHPFNVTNVSVSGRVVGAAQGRLTLSLLFSAHAEQAVYISLLSINVNCRLHSVHFSTFQTLTPAQRLSVVGSSLRYELEHSSLNTSYLSTGVTRGCELVVANTTFAGYLAGKRVRCGVLLVGTGIGRAHVENIHFNIDHHVSQQGDSIIAPYISMTVIPGLDQQIGNHSLPHSIAGQENGRICFVDQNGDTVDYNCQERYQ